MKLRLSLLCTTLIVSCATYAMDFGGLAGKKEEKSNAAATVDAYAMQDNLTKTYVAAATQLFEAKKGVAKALGLDDKIALLDAETKALSSGAVDEGKLKAATATSASTDQAIAEKMKNIGELNADSRKEFGKAMLPYFASLKLSKTMMTDLGNFPSAAKQQFESAGMMEKGKVMGKLAAGTYLAKEMPGFLSNQGSMFKDMYAFAKGKKIEMDPSVDPSSLL